MAKLSYFSPVYDFFKCKRTFSSNETFKQPIKFRCIICTDKELEDRDDFTATVGSNANLVHHLKDNHCEYRQWKEKYDEYKKRVVKEEGKW